MQTVRVVAQVPGGFPLDVCDQAPEQSAIEEEYDQANEQLKLQKNGNKWTKCAVNFIAWKLIMS